jgi:hypothetical protein
MFLCDQQLAHDNLTYKQLKARKNDEYNAKIRYSRCVFPCAYCGKNYCLIRLFLIKENKNGKQKNNTFRFFGRLPIGRGVSRDRCLWFFWGVLIWIS